MKDIISALQRLGLSQYESRAYVGLVRHPTVTAYELAKQTGIPPSKVYEVLERLRAKQLVGVIETGGPPRYAPLDPGEAVARYRRSYEELLDGVEEKLEKIHSAAPTGNGYVWNLQGEEAVLSKAEDMIAEAEQELLTALWPQQLDRLRESLIAAERRGTKVAVCLYGQVDSGAELPGVKAVYNHPTDHVVLRDQGARRMVVVSDTTEALVGYFPETDPADGVWSANSGFVHMAKDYVRHDIWVIKLVEGFEAPITAFYGPDRAKLRDIYDLERPDDGGVGGSVGSDD
jgi:sugar-specific transcriptional regulator TrmB